MTAAELTALQPTAQTGADIRAALARIAAAKTSAESRIRDLEAEAEERRNSFTLTSTHRRKTTDQVEDLQLDVSMLNALAAKVEAPLEDIERRERDARLGEQHAVLMTRMGEFSQKFELEYWSHHEALAGLLADNAALLREAEAHNREVAGIFRPLDLTDFRRPQVELRLCKTRKERLMDQVQKHWSPISDQYQRALILDEDKLAAYVLKLETTPVLVRPTAAQLYTPPAKPTVTIGGVVQDQSRYQAAH